MMAAFKPTFLNIMVWVAGLEPAASCSQGTRSPTWATPRYKPLLKLPTFRLCASSHIGRLYPCSFFPVCLERTTYEQPVLLKRGVYTTVHSRIVAAEARLELALHRVKVCCLYHSTTRQYEWEEVDSNHRSPKWPLVHQAQRTEIFSPLL